MGYYRLRPIEAKVCAHCLCQFETRHKRTTYCSDSCRQLAYQLRRGLNGISLGKASKKPQEGLKSTLETNLPLNGQNVLTVAAGATAARLLGNLFDDPQAKTIRELQGLRSEVKQLTAMVAQVHQEQRDLVSVTVATNSQAAAALGRIQRQRHDQQSKLSKVNELLASRNLPPLSH